MVDPSRPDAPDEEVRASRQADATVPRWVKVLAISGIALVLLIVLMVSGVFGGQHGPGRHLPDAVPGGQAPGDAHDSALQGHR